MKSITSIKTWLKYRASVSNTLNAFDKYNKPSSNNKIFNSISEATIYLNNLILKNYKYRLDMGDRIRTPISVWNRAHSNENLVDDCDGSAALAIECMRRCGISAELISIVPTDEFWKGHSLCFYKKDKNYVIIDYGKILTTSATLDKCIEEIIKVYMPTNKNFVISIDRFTTKWENKNVYEWSKI